MKTDLDDFFAAMAARKRERDRKRNGLRVDDPLNLVLRDWRVPNPGPIVPNAGMAARLVG